MAANEPEDAVALELARLGLVDVSVRLLSGRGVWDELSALFAPRTSAITAAVAYVGSTAATWLPLRAGSTLIVNASLASVRSGATDPSTLLAWLRAGVKVSSLDSLHAKMILVDGVVSFLAIGSANISQSSATRLDEAVVVTDSTGTIAAARVALVSWQSLATPLSEQDVKRLIGEYQSPDRPEPSGDDTEPETAHPAPAEPTYAGQSHPRPWPRPDAIYIAKLTPADNASPEAIQIHRNLAAREGIDPEAQYEAGDPLCDCSVIAGMNLTDGDASEAPSTCTNELSASRLITPQSQRGAGDFAISKFCDEIPEDVDPADMWFYQQGSYVVSVETDRAFRARKDSSVEEPGRVLHIYKAFDEYPKRVYYYLLHKVSGEEYKFSELREALTAIGERVDYQTRYLRPRVIAAIVDMWGDIAYTNRQVSEQIRARQQLSHA